MGRLQILPANIANMIAAGEVVQRPASVVKELMENSIDAGAAKVSVVISDSGRTLIQVIDNGCGMTARDAELCFERHATSKISTAEDLEGILTYGFRGEALASIAAVSEVTLKTRIEGEETAVQVVIDGTGTKTVSSVSAPVGTNIAVRNLFFNTPARRKFLKSDNVELKHIVEEFSRVVLTRPEIAFSLTHNGRDLYVLKPAKSLKFRIQDLLGASLTGEMVDIDTRTSIVTVRGYIGRPDSSRKTVGNQFFFVNGRFFRSPYLHKAVMKAYEEYIPEGVNPSYFLYLEMDPQSMDVNIHPTKTEIKFEDDSVLFQTLFACVREALGKGSFGAGIDFDADGAVDIPVIGRNFEEYRQIDIPSKPLDPDYNPFDNESIKPNYNFDRQVVTPRESYGRLFEEKTLPSSQVIILHGKYILSPSRTGLMVVNIRRAWERILFEHFLKALNAEKNMIQKELFPVSVQVGVQGRLLFEEKAEMLCKAGFDIAPFGNDTVVVNGIPEGFSNESGKVRRMVEDLLSLLSEGGNLLQETMSGTMATKLAMLGAANAEVPSTPFEAQKLLDLLTECGNSEYTNKGHKIMAILSEDDLEKEF